MSLKFMIDGGEISQERKKIFTDILIESVTFSPLCYNRSATDTCNRCLQVSLVELHLVWKTRMSLQVAKMKELLLEEAAA